MVSCSGIKAVVLYGSHARGDATRESDVDVCLFVVEGTKPTEGEVGAFAPSLPKGQASLTIYDEGHLAAMLKHGSLFLWHVKLEGRILYGTDYLAEKIKTLEPFRRHHQEIVYHADLLGDLLRVVEDSTVSNEFDLALLFTIARNTCMILAHKAGVPAFGRADCYDTAARLFPDLPLNREVYFSLSRWKSVYERGLDADEQLPSVTAMSQLLKRMQWLLEYADARTR